MYLNPTFRWITTTNDKSLHIYILTAFFSLDFLTQIILAPYTSYKLFAIKKYITPLPSARAHLFNF